MLNSFQDFERIRSALQSTQEAMKDPSLTKFLNEAQENYYNALSHMTNINEAYLRLTLEKEQYMVD